jgi:hypothetical protein
MKPPRRKFLHLVASAAALATISRIAIADTYPTRPVHIIVGFAVGGPNDICARLIGQWLSERLGQPFVIENRPGAGSNLATEVVVRAAPDGYTLLLVNPANAVNSTLYEKLRFHPRYRTCRGHLASAQRPGGQSIISGRNSFRVHHLCKGEPGQDQPGFARYWHHGTCRWRVIQA